MSSSLTQLIDSWRTSQDEAITLALCERLAAEGPPELVREVGAAASTRYASSAKVLLAVGRMFLRRGRLGAAQGALVAAGRLAPRNPLTWRSLAETLLRRGDAERACKAFERALALGDDQPNTRRWAAHARALAAVQRSSGPRAVSAELARRLVEKQGQPGLGAATCAPSAAVNAGAEHPGDAAASEPAPAAQPPLEAQPPPPAARPTAAPPAWTPPPPTAAPPARTPPPPTAARPARTPPPPPPAPRTAAPRSPAATRPYRSTPPLPTALPPALPNRTAAAAAPPPAPAPPGSAHRAPALPPTSAFEPDRAVAADVVSAPSALLEHATRITSLSSLEPHTRPHRPSGDLSDESVTGSTWGARLFLVAVLAFAAASGALRYRRDQWDSRLVAASRLVAEANAMLLGGRREDVAAVETTLDRALSLTPSDQGPALELARARAVQVLTTGGDPAAIQQAVERARLAGVPEHALAAARIAVLLATGNFAGARALSLAWEGRASDPYYHVLAGASLERDGDPRAIEHYRSAAEIEQHFLAARILHARALIIDGQADRGLELAFQTRRDWPSRSETAVLVAFARARFDPHARDLEDPSLAAADLPQALASVPPLVGALDAARKGARAEARTLLIQALAGADSPGLLSYLGGVALDLGDDELARRAAEEAEKRGPRFSAARTLAARVALSLGRYDEAETAVSSLDAADPEVATVRALVAYERLDLPGLASAIAAAPAAARARPPLAQAALALDVLRGAVVSATQLRQLAASASFGADLVCVDAALDAGNLGLASELLDRAAAGKTRPPRALRVARLLRYSRRPDLAEEPSRTAATEATPRSAFERIQTLLAADRVEEARGFANREDSGLGPLAAWVSAHIDSDGPHALDARRRIAPLALPAAGDPLPTRIAAAMALAELGDRRRAVVMLRPLPGSFTRNPDVQAASRALR